MSYTAKDIKTLSFVQAVRSRIAMYMGSADNQGVLQCIREIITNSIDEATMGYGNKIEVYISPSQNLVEVVDYGRGVPFGKRDDGTEAMIAIYTASHTGGKFDNKTYQNVAGMNGVGGAGTALSAAEFSAVSHRDGKIARLDLKDGEVINYYEKQSNSPSRTGTSVRFIPSQEVFNLEPIHIDFEEVKKMCRDWSYLMKGITFHVTNLDTNDLFEYCAPHGLIDMMKDNCNKTLNKTPLHIEVEEDGIKVEIVMSWTDSRTEEWHVFTNGLENSEGGTSLTGVKTALTNYFKKKMKDVGSPDTLRKGLYYAVSCQVPNPSFANQTKTKVNNPELRGLCQRATGQMLEDFENRHQDEFNKVIDLLAKEVKADIAAERARKQVLNATKEIEKNQKLKVFSSDKLKRAEFEGQDSILLLVEGDSAAGSMAKARDIKKYGILGLRGKPINAFTNDDEKLLQNEEVKLLLSAMNISPDKSYNSKNLNYGKLAICSDADADGYSIGLLIMCLIYKYAPQFIEEGRLYWLRSPLYIVKKGKEEHYFFTDEEFAQCKIKGEVIRAKGLGALSPEQARRSMFNPEFQRMEQLIPDEESYRILSELMGKDSEPKKKFVFNNIDFSTIRE